jgi:class 3 adenylate cyclase
MDRPVVRYAKSGNVHVAYQLFGSGSLNLIVTPGSISHLDYYWQEPGLRRFLEELGNFANVAVFDKRGTGLSDRESGVPTYEERMDDIRAVMDAANFHDALLMGLSEGTPMSVLFAASYPSRTKGLVLYGSEAKGMWSPDYPWEATREEWEESFERTDRTWGTMEATERAVKALAPSRLGDEKFSSWLGEMRRMGSSPGAAIALGRSEMNMDVRSILPSIHVPTVVIHLRDDKAVDVGEGRFVASHIPGARLVELPGVDHMFFVDKQLTDRILEEIRGFASGLESAVTTDRMLATVVFTDIVDSTKKVAQLGDLSWQKLLQKHNSMITNEIHKFRGELVKNTGDGFLAIFDGPTRAIRCAWDVTRYAKQLGIEVRAGLHTGECIVTSADVSGIAVHIASRIMNEASGGEVLVSSTVKDLVYGSGVSFTDRGEYLLKGLEDKRKLFSVQTVPS